MMLLNYIRLAKINDFSFFPRLSQMADKSSKILFNPFDTVEESSTSLDDFEPQVRLIFKKLLKKEPSTRIKGLEELATWLRDCDEALFQSISPQFVKVYVADVIDEERKIRELANSCLLVIVEREKKWLSSLAKELCFSWLGCLDDPVASVSSVSRKAFDLCFGKSRYRDVCSIFGKSIISKSIDHLENQNALEMTMIHGFNAAIFILENSSETFLKDLEDSLLLSLCLFRPHLTKFPAVMALYYKVIRILLERNYSIQSSSSSFASIALNDSLFENILNDLTTRAATEAAILLKSFDSNFFSTRDDCQINLLKKSLIKGLGTEIPKPAISHLAGIAKKFDLLDAIWMAIDKCRKFDTGRLLEVWKLFVACLHQFPTKDYFIHAIELIPTIPRDASSKISSLLRACNEEMFDSCLLSVLDGNVLSSIDKLKLLTDCPPDAIIDQSLLETLFKSLTFDSQNVILERVLQVDYTLPWHKSIISIMINTCQSKKEEKDNNTDNNNDDQIQSLSKRLACLKVTPNLQIAVNKLTSNLLSSPPTRKKLAILNTLLSNGHKIFINKVFAEFALEKAEDDNLDAHIVVLSYLNLDITMPMEICKPFQSLASKAVKLDDLTRINAIQTFVHLLSNNSSLKSSEIEHSIPFLFDLDHSLYKTLITLILKDYPVFAEELLHSFKTKYPGLITRLEEHLVTKSMALLSFPLLYQHIEKTDSLSLWNEFDFVDALYTILKHCSELTEEVKDLIITLSAFKLCITEEQKYRTNDNDTEKIIPSLEQEQQQQCCILANKFYTKGGFYIVLAKELNMEININDMELLQSAFPSKIELLMLAKVKTDDDLDLLQSCSCSDDQILTIMASDCHWTEDNVYQLMALLPPLDYLLREKVNVAIVCSFFITAVRVGIDKEEYWQAHHRELIDSLANLFLDVASNKEHRLKYHLLIRLLIELAMAIPVLGKHLLLQNLPLLWERFEAISCDEPIKILQSTSVKQVTKLIASIDCNSWNFVSNDRLVRLLCEKMHFSAGQNICRKILSSRLDGILEEARIKLSKSIQQAQNSDEIDIIIPIPALQKHLTDKECIRLMEQQQQSSMTSTTNNNTDIAIDANDKHDFLLMNKLERSINHKLHAMDIFLSLTEGSSECGILFTAYAEYFKNKIVDELLPVLTNGLEWTGDHPVDLSKVEFTIIDHDRTVGYGKGEGERTIQFMSNILFRCFKAFPTVIKSWYANLARGNASLVLKHTREFLSPLLIQRELAKLRNAKLDPVKIQIIQTSTTVSVQVFYHLEEFQLSLNLDIPSTFPLQAVTVEGGNRLGISESKWRLWLLSVQSLLSRNLSLVEVIRQWRSNAEKVLQGVEPCSVCYCVLQPSDRSLPGPNCKTCRNKFHSGCLYKWFKTSGQATCPMCRALF